MSGIDNTVQDNTGENNVDNEEEMKVKIDEEVKTRSNDEVIKQPLSC